MPKISVVIPTHNRPCRLLKTINSVAKQTFEDIEIIVVNDNEDEKAVKRIISEINDKRVYYLRNQRKKGANGARNTGLNSARGEFIAFLDDDDIWYKKKIQKQIEIFNLSSSRIGLIYTGFKVVSNEKKSSQQDIYPQKKGYLFDDILNGNFIGSPTPLIRKTVFLDCGYYDEKLKSSQDWDLWIRIAKYYRIDFIPEILAEYTVHGDQISTNFIEKAVSFTYILEKYNEFYENNKAAKTTLGKKISVLLFLGGDIKNSRKNLIKSYFTDGIRLDITAHLMLSLIPKFYEFYIKRYITNKIGDLRLVY